MSLPTSVDMPDIRRPDAMSVFVSYWYVPDRESGLADLREVVEQWSGTQWPEELVSFACFLSTEDDTVLTYAQCADADAYRIFQRSLKGVARAEAVEYRLRHSVVLDAPIRDPGCMIIAMFDVDGPERQDRIIGSLADAVEQAPIEQHPGMISANFHASADGTRVLNYAEWVSDEAHIAFLDGATRATTLRVSNSFPGVRPIGFKRFHLYRGIGS